MNKIVRVAWFDRKARFVSCGSWKKITTIERMKSFMDWIDEQNKKYKYVQYWIEEKDFDENQREIAKNMIINTHNITQSTSSTQTEPLILEDYVLITEKKN